MLHPRFKTCRPTTSVNGERDLQANVRSSAMPGLKRLTDSTTPLLAGGAQQGPGTGAGNGAADAPSDGSGGTGSGAGAGDGGTDAGIDQPEDTRPTLVLSRVERLRQQPAKAAAPQGNDVVTDEAEVKTNIN